MTGDWKTRKTEPRFPSVSHCPWKSLRDSHIPTAPADSVSENVQTNLKKGAPESRIAHFPPSGSFFNEKMLSQYQRRLWLSETSIVLGSLGLPTP